MVAAFEPFYPTGTNLKIYPNPTAEHFLAEPPAKKGLFELFGDRGKSIFSIQTNGKQPVEMNIPKGASGIFWLRFLDEKSGRVWSEKLLKF